MDGGGDEWVGRGDDGEGAEVNNWSREFVSTHTGCSHEARRWIHAQR